MPMTFPMANFNRNVGSIRQLFPSNAIFDLDATIAESYNGGQTWKNIVKTPADASAQSAYDFYLGNSNAAAGDDPTFTGGLGNPAAYFSMDGGDRFQLAGAVSSAAFLNTIQQKKSHTIILALNHVNSASADLGLFASTDTYNADNRGISYYGGWSNTFYRQRTSTGLVSANRSQTPNTAADRVIAFSYDSATDTVTSYWNSSTGNSTAMVWNATAENWVGTNPTIGSIGNSSYISNGTKIYACALLNKSINSTEMRKILDFYNARHCRKYA